MSDIKIPEGATLVEVPGPTKEEAAKKQSETFVQTEGITIKLLEDAAVLELANGTVKTISLSDFHTLINGCFGKVTEETGSEIVLPLNCFYIATGPKSIKLSVYYPETVRELQYSGRSSSSPETYKIPVPNIVICASLSIKSDKEAVVTTAKYFCTDRPLASLGTKWSSEVSRGHGLYLLPFSNIYEDAKLCTGGNVMPAMTPKDLRKINWYHDVLFNSPFNDDLGVISIGGDFTPRDWYKFLALEAAAGRKFPYSKLRGYSPYSPTL